MEDKNIKRRKRETSEEKILNKRGRLMAVQIKMYWLAWRMQERMKIDIDYSNQDSNLILR